MTVYQERLKPQSRVEELLQLNDEIVEVENLSDQHDGLVVISVTTETTEWRLKSNRWDGSLTGEPPLMIDCETGKEYESHGQYVPKAVLSAYQRYVRHHSETENKKYQ